MVLVQNNKIQVSGSRRQQRGDVRLRTTGRDEAVGGQEMKTL